MSKKKKKSKSVFFLPGTRTFVERRTVKYEEVLPNDEVHRRVFLDSIP